VVLTIDKRASGNRHWHAATDRGTAHRIHEGTLRKYDVLEER
jgi:hypothetical protein